MKNTRRLIALAAVLVTLLAAPAVSLGQDADAPTDTFTGPNIEDGPVPWLAILYTLVACAGIGVVAFKNAKRTHLD